MRLGIDFGTTHTVAALVDRGNYPVVAFAGDDLFPSVAAVATASDELRFGPRALAALERPGWRPVRSFKRLLAAVLAHLEEDQAAREAAQAARAKAQAERAAMAEKMQRRMASTGGGVDAPGGMPGGLGGGA